MIARLDLIREGSTWKMLELRLESRCEEMRKRKKEYPGGGDSIPAAECVRLLMDRRVAPGQPKHPDSLGHCRSSRVPGQMRAI